MSEETKTQIIPMPDPAYQFEKCVVNETVTQEIIDPTTELPVYVEIEQPITKEDGTPITGADLEAIQEHIQLAATLGIACAKCGTYHGLKPTQDLTSYQHADPSIPIIKLQDDSVTFVCPCGNLITLIAAPGPQQ